MTSRLKSAARAPLKRKNEIETRIESTERHLSFRMTTPPEKLMLISKRKGGAHYIASYLSRTGKPCGCAVMRSQIARDEVAALSKISKTQGMLISGLRHVRLGDALPYQSHHGNS